MAFLRGKPARDTTTFSAQSECDPVEDMAAHCVAQHCGGTESWQRALGHSQRTEGDRDLASTLCDQGDGRAAYMSEVWPSGRDVVSKSALESINSRATLAWPDAMARMSAVNPL